MKTFWLGVSRSVQIPERLAKIYMFADEIKAIMRSLATILDFLKVPVFSLVSN